MLWCGLAVCFLLFVGAVHGAHGGATAVGNGAFVGALLLVVFVVWRGIRGGA